MIKFRSERSIETKSSITRRGGKYIINPSPRCDECGKILSTPALLKSHLIEHVTEQQLAAILEVLILHTLTLEVLLLHTTYTRRTHDVQRY